MLLYLKNNIFQAYSDLMNLFIFSGPASKLMFKLCLALWCGIIGSFFTFPGLRFAKMHKDALKYCAERTFLKYGFYVLDFKKHVFYLPCNVC